MNDPETMQLLTEIRDAQRELVAEYRRVTNESLALQRQAVERQTQALQIQDTNMQRVTRSIKLSSQNAIIYRVVVALVLVCFVYLMVSIVRHGGW
jgi:hypothetical protein